MNKRPKCSSFLIDPARFLIGKQQQQQQQQQKYPENPGVVSLDAHSFSNHVTSESRDLSRQDRLELRITFNSGKLILLYER